MGIKYILLTSTVITREMKHNMLKSPTLRSLVHLGSLRVGPLAIGPGASMTVGEPFYKRWKAVIGLAVKSGLMKVHKLVEGEIEGKEAPIPKPTEPEKPVAEAPVEPIVHHMATPVEEIVEEPAEELVELERAREEDGTFAPDDPETEDVNEAWEEVAEEEPVDFEEEVIEEVAMTASDLNKKNKKDLTAWIIEQGVDVEKTEGKTKRKLIDLAIEEGLI